MIIASFGAGRPVNRSTCAKAWFSSICRPPTTRPPAAANAVASGVAIGVARLVATKGAATAKMKLTGRVPEGMEGPKPTPLSRLTGKE